MFKCINILFQIVIIEHKSIICAGYSAVLHLHACAEEITIKGLLCIIDKKTGEKTQIKPRFVRQDQIAIARMEVNGGLICLESFKDFPQMGRFTLRDEGKYLLSRHGALFSIFCLSEFKSFSYIFNIVFQTC